MKIVFMGTPDFAAGALRSLLDAGHEVIAVVTQPDKAKGRSKALIESPVKSCAAEHGIPVLQPRRIRTPEAVEELKAYPAELYIVAAFGQILSREILDIPRLGCLNIHASLLPKYRGASPIQRVIMDGEEKTGITIMQMDEGIDTGDMLYQKEIPIAREETYETLSDKLTALGGEAIVEALSLLEQGKLTPRKQEDALSSYAPLIGKEMGAIDFAKDAEAIERLVRAFNPWPSAYTAYRGKQLKIWKAEAVSGNFQESAGKSPACGGKATEAAGETPAPGEILEVGKDFVTVAAGRGALKIYELQLEGKKRMSAHDFLLGVKMKPGEMLG